MAAPLLGAGYLRVIDLLQDASYKLFEPVVNLSFPANIAAGSRTIAVGDPSLYINALIVCGSGTDLEVVTVTAVTANSFTATFANAHTAGEPILGATFPVRYPTDPLFTQAEMIAYLSTAFNDFLTDVPLIYNAANVSVPPTQQNVALPSDTEYPVRAAFQKYPLRETSQADLDANQFNWAQQGLSLPRVFFRDKIPQQNIGIWPRAGNLVNLEVVYAQRQAETLGWADGFLIPDPLVIYPWFKCMAFAYSKDGEARNPGLAKYYGQRYEFGVNVAKMLLDIVNDPNLQLAAS